MTKIPVGAALAAVVTLLAGCGGEAAEPDATGAAPEAASPADNSADPRDDRAGFPDAMVGRWGLVPADCTSTMGDAKGLMTITPERVAFYESRATIAELHARSASSVSADMAFSGEGQEWTTRMALELGTDGETLVRRDSGDNAMPEPLEYTRCAGDEPRA